MLRIPNPGSDIDGFIRIFREIHSILGNRMNFGVDDISRALVATHNVTAQGAIGEEALRRSTRKDRSRDPIYNQSKMYSELYRSHGWIHSTDSSLTFCITVLGHHMATAVDPRALMKECLLGMAFPNEVLSVKVDQTIRIFAVILQSLAALEHLSRDEMILGPFSMRDDTQSDQFDAMIDELKRLRTREGALSRRLDSISKKRNIKRHPTMENYTRYPMAALPWAGWATRSKSGVLRVTYEGQETAKRLRSLRDFRLADFGSLPDHAKRPFIISTTYRMLERGGFDLEPIGDVVVKEETAIYEAGIRGDPLFSPFQQLSRNTIVLHAREMISVEGMDAETAKESGAVELATEIRGARFAILAQPTAENFVATNRTKEVVEVLKDALSKEGGSISAARESLANRFQRSNKNVFYPLVTDLFVVLGFECITSRAGVNYARADAMILDPEASIPIEIKSPSEEREISVKGVRQALENKIVLLARRAYKTRRETTSLVIGFNPPNERAEVRELIEDIHRSFEINIAVMDFRTLLCLALQSVLTERRVIIPGFQIMRGLIRVEIASTVR